MKRSPIQFSPVYLKELRRHLRLGASSDLGSALKWGLRAVKYGLGAADIAKIHEDSMITLKLRHPADQANDEAVRHAGLFLAGALAPLEDAHQGAKEANIQLKGVIGKLRQRTAELSKSNSDLSREIARRSEVEKSLRTSETTTSQLLEKSRLMQAELRLLSRRLLSVQEEERKRISRELHDVIAQVLTSINVRLATLTLQSTASTKELHKKISIAQRLVEKSVEIVHGFARDLRPTVLDDLGLTPALKSYLKEFTAQTGLPVSFTTFAGLEKMPGASRTALYRVAQEALANISRHAKARRAKVSIQEINGGVRMEISDDGTGFQVSRPMASKVNQGLGILGMRERVEMVGGIFSLSSKPGKGTTVRVELSAVPAFPKKTSFKKA